MEIFIIILIIVFVIYLIMKSLNKATNKSIQPATKKVDLPFEIKVTTSYVNGNSSQNEEKFKPIKQVDNNSTLLNTYYVYNDLEQLAYVIPPKVAMGSYSEKATIFNELIYAYHYDERGRLKEKHIPGTGWTYLVYNKLDQLILSQDSIQRVGSSTISPKTWIFTKYDLFGRVVMTGSIVKDSTRDNIQAKVNNETTFWETKTSLSTQYYYSNTAYPRFTDYNCLLTINYYDNYVFDPDSKSFQSALGYTAASTMTQGLSTGSKVKVLDGSNTWLTTLNYYDDKGRPIQVHNKKYSSSGSTWDRLTTNYDFEGKAIKTERYHNSILTITNRYTYDQSGRKKAVYQQMNSDPEVELAEYNYNELGQLVKKNIHGNSSSKLQGINYRYNIRGWLTSINNAKLNNDGILNDESNVAFGEELNYTNSFTAGNTTGTAQWNGNISGITWKSKGPAITYSSVNVNAYAFQYDKENRLTLANYGSGTNIATWNDNPGRYNEAVSYDGMGNILTLQRNGIQGAIDTLTYAYLSNSNKLISVTDAINDPNGFNDGNKTGNDYTYDGNGNLTTDLNKGLTISYNYLNLPQSVSSASQGKAISYIYDATGKKLKKSFPGQPDHYYMDGIEYDGPTLLFAMTEEGRVRPRSNGTYTYDYFLKDHLGNIHVVLSSDTPSLTNYPTATMETGTAALESTYYANLDATRFAKPSGFDTNSGNLNVARVNSSQQIGPSITLKVNAGDVLNLGVKSFYQSSGSNYNRNALATTALSQLLTALLSPMALSGTTLAKATDGVNTQAFGNSTNYQTMMGSLPLSNYNSSPSNTPKAYLVWLLFDNEFNLIKTGNSSGMLQVPTGADQLKTLAQTGITMDKSGFFYAYVVNESSMNVYFDDFQVSTTIGPVLEENNYYPFGLLNAQLSAPGMANPINKYKYNGKELQNELSLAWLDYGARFYDSQIGRWHVIDGKAELYFNWSPYTYALNTPVNAIDPNGSLVIFINGMHNGSGGSKNYWQSESVNFAGSLMNRFNDRKDMYIDGSRNVEGTKGGLHNLFNNVSSSYRYDVGYINGHDQAATIITSLIHSGGVITESIKIVAHSMGAAYAKGFVQAIINY